MIDPAQKLIGHKDRAASFVPMQQSRLRIGMWPVKSDTHPEVAMGLAAFLAFLLERWRSIHVYRLFFRADAQSLMESYQWSIADSQYDIDDWQLDNLDENIAIWGKLKHDNGLYSMSLEIENDLASEEEELKTIAVDSLPLSELVAHLPEVAKQIATYLDASEPDIFLPIYTAGKWNENDLSILLKAAFQWEIIVLFDLFEKPSLSELRKSTCEALLEAAVKVEDLGAWVAGNALSRPLLPLYSLEDVYIPLIENHLDYFEDNGIYGLLLALAFFRAEYTEKAYTLLESEAESHPEYTLLWLTLGELYRQGREYSAALDAFQRGIIAKSVSHSLYMRYASLLVALDASNINLNFGVHRQSPLGREFVEDLLLVNSQEKRRTGNLIQEAIKAYQAAFELDPSQREALTQFLIYQIEQTGTIDWMHFERLIVLDDSGEDVRSVVEEFYNLDNASIGLDILKSACAKNPERVDLSINLAAAYLANDKNKSAVDVLKKAYTLPGAGSYLVEIERLLISAEDPDFEMRLGEITDLVNSGNDLDVDDIEFLEAALEKAPHLGSLYVLLAGGYLVGSDTSDALDVLLDGQKYLPDDPAIAATLARILWQSDEHQLAFEALKKGLAKNPNHVPLLALTGRYLFDENQDASARSFLSKAEAIDPLDGTLNEVRRYIASKVTDGD